MSKFKVGDWIEVISQGYTNPYKVVEVYYDDDLEMEVLGLGEEHVSADLCKYWEPAAGEWCWFSTTEIRNSNIGILRKFTEIEYYEGIKYYKCVSIDIDERDGVVPMCRYCEPFIGNLPSYVVK